MEEIKKQLVFLLGSFLSGIAVMLAYETINVLRQLFKLRVIGKLFWDLLFFSVSGVMVFRMVFMCNNGTLRSFFIVAFACGAWLYRKTFGTTLSSVVVKVVRSAVKQLVRPYVWICKKIGKKEKKTSKKP